MAFYCSCTSHGSLLTERRAASAVGSDGLSNAEPRAEGSDGLSYELLNAASSDGEAAANPAVAPKEIGRGITRNHSEPQGSKGNVCAAQGSTQGVRQRADSMCVVTDTIKGRLCAYLCFCRAWAGARHHLMLTVKY